LKWKNLTDRVATQLGKEMPMLISRKELIKYYIFELNNAYNQREFGSIRRAMQKELSDDEYSLVMKNIDERR
jgi:hypothetical protein